MGWDFLDLLPQGAPAAAAGEGASNIIDKSIQRQIDFEKLNDAIVKNDIDRKVQMMTLPAKIMGQNLETAQKINVIDPAPTGDHMRAAFSELYPDLDPTELDKLDETQKSGVFQRARELAKEDLPKIDPFDPTAWMKARGADAISDVQAKMMEQEAQVRAMLAREKAKQEAIAMENAMKRTFTEQENEKNRKQSDTNNKRSTGASIGNNIRTQRGQDTRQDKKEAQDLYQALLNDYGKKRFKSHNDRLDIIAKINAIDAKGDPETSAAAKKAFAKELSKEGVGAAQPVGTIPNYNGTGPRAVWKAPGAHSSDVQEKIIGGQVFRKNNNDGHWYKVK